MQVAVRCLSNEGETPRQVFLNGQPANCRVALRLLLTGERSARLNTGAPLPRNTGVAYLTMGGPLLENG